MKIRKILLENRFWKSIVRKRIPVGQWLGTKTFGLGLINISLFMILIATGTLLMFYYIPHTDSAYRSIMDLRYGVSFGLIFRNLHRWSAYLMIVSVFLHMSRVFFMAEYRNPREFNWVIGLTLFLCTLGMGLTGYILPWDQKGFWAMTILSNVAGSIPAVGDELKYVILGGTQVDQSALTRAFALHTRLVPLVMVILMTAHIWRIRQDDRLSGAVPDDPEKQFETIKWNTVLTRELSKFMLILVIAMAAALLFDAPLEERANPSVTPNPTKAPWFVLGLQELVSWGAPFWSAVVVPTIALIFFILIPYVERGTQGTGVWFHPSRRLQNILFTAFVTVALGLIFVGMFMRGPNWGFYWPWEPWPRH